MRISLRKQEKEIEGERGKGERERASGERGGETIKKMPAAIKTTESIKNFRPFTAELPWRRRSGIYAGSQR